MGARHRAATDPGRAVLVGRRRVRARLRRTAARGLPTHRVRHGVPVPAHVRSWTQVITGLDHVQLAIPEGGEELARRFYGDLLGMTEVPKPAALAGRGGCWFTGGSA